MTRARLSLAGLSRLSLARLSLAVSSLPVAMALVFSAPANAGDPRLVERMYDPNEVVLIRGKVKVQATVTFGEGESIENVAIGDSQSWQVTPNKRGNLLFVKPLSPSAQTNMTVVTNKHTYLFDLVASPRNKPLYVLKFTYPEPEVSEQEAAQLAAAEAPPPEKANATEMAAATDPLAVVDPARLNFEWAATGDPALLPTRTYDDGELTFLSWPEGNQVPAILVRNHEGEEGPVNFTVRGNVVVVQDVPREIILRTGDDVALLTNNGPDRSAERREAALLAQSTEEK